VCVLTAAVLSFPRPVRSPECVFPEAFSAFVHTFLARVIIIALVYIIFDDENIRRIQAMR